VHPPTAVPRTPTLIAAWVGFVTLCVGAGFASAMLADDTSVYEELARPSWAPPGNVFGPVWTVLYIAMGSAAFLVWKHDRGESRRRALAIFAVQLALNVAWTPVFFGLQRYGLAIVVIAGYWLSVLGMLIVFARRIRLAGLLVAPLLAWVTFATALNIAIWSLNR
jgi:translocator protein